MMPDNFDDGFSPTPETSRGGRSANYLKWTAEEGWRDRDGILPPQPLLVLSVGEFLRRWKDGRIGTVNAVRPYSDYGAVAFRGRESVESHPKAGAATDYRPWGCWCIRVP